jgi:saccharopepsin
MTDVRPSPTNAPGLSRRGILQGAGALGLSSLVGGSALAAARLTLGTTATGLLVPQVRGPFQNNGATPWYANLGIGTPGQNLKIALDTGSNFIWSTSSLCDPASNSCKHYGNAEFVYQNSSSFQWIDQTRLPVSFGPWGTMTVETGADHFTFPGAAPLPKPTAFYLAQSYTGTQFAELDWDGGIGFPSGSAYVQPGVSFMMADLMNAGVVNPAYPYLSFNWNAASKAGTCQIGGVDPSAFDARAGIKMPWQPYTEYPGVSYIWTTPLQKYVYGNQVLPISPNAMFALDSGSSQFKGDDDIMNQTLALIAMSKMNLQLQVGQSTVTGAPGIITIPPSVYEVLIEAGSGQGQTLPQFNPLDLKNLVLVGSVLMDQFYTVFEYSVTEGPDGYTLSPANMYLYNKINGPQLIQPSSGTPIAIGGPKPVGSVLPSRL